MATLEELQLENHRLRSLTNSFYLLNSSLDLQTVLKNTLTQATELMNAETGSIALINDEQTHLVFVESTDPNFSMLKQITVPIGKGIAGAVAASGRPERIDDVSRDSRFYGQVDEKMGHRTQAYLCVPLMVNQEIIGTAQIMNRKDGSVFTKDDEDLMQGFARQASLAIQNARMHAILLKQKAIESELGICSEIQRKLFPESTPDLPQYELFGQSSPCREVGGDYYGYFARPDGSVDLVVADVSGKGLPAALLVSELHTGLRMLDGLAPDLESAVNSLNRHLAASIVIGRFIGVFLLRLWPHTGEAEYVLAGTPPPLVVRADGSEFELETTGPVLGLPRAVYRTIRFQLQPGDLMLAYSDGYSEAMGPDDELFGEERLRLLTREWAGMPLQRLAFEIDQVVNQHRSGRAANDDSTLLILRRKTGA